MNDDHGVHPVAQGKVLGIEDCSKLSLEAVSFNCALQASPGAQSYARLALAVVEDSYRQRRAPRPFSSSINRAEGLGPLQGRFVWRG